MRAIGASDGAIGRLVVVEGLVVALVSWPLAVLLAVPIQSVLASIVADFFLRAPLTTRSGPTGAIVWLAVVLVLAALSSWLPARAAARVTVIDALAYS
jgi:putative ABC transport system permease protein